jgi:hypothetical protein
VRYEELVTPSEHLGVLIAPRVAELRRTLEGPAAAAYERVAILDTSLGALRSELREQLGVRVPAIVVGHQPEFFHAGVFAKTIAAHALAAQRGGEAIFLTVDSDLPKTAQLTIPQITSAGVRRVDVDIPGCDPQVAFEFQAPRPREHWLQFFARIGALHESYGQSLLGAFARAWLATPGAPLPYCEAMLAGRAATETALGLDGVRELRISQLCTTPVFRTFAAHLLLHARRMAECYNAAQSDYRRRHRVRAAGQPVPPLLISSDAVEVPFWLVRRDEPRRRLFVTPRDGSLELRTDNAEVGRLQLDDLAASRRHAEAWPIEHAGWQLRPRALTLSCFARFLLADLFIHGIGGAKYDEMMEEFAEAFFGVAPAPLGCVSATLHLPLPHSRLRWADILAARRDSRDLRHNPQRHVAGLPAPLLTERTELVRRSQELAAHAPRDHESRRLVFRALRRLNEQMLEADPWRAAKYDERVQTLEDRWQLDRVALDREYFYALHRQEALAELVKVVQRDLQAPA